MRKIIDLTGMVFGRLTVIGFSGTTEHGQSKWRCLCSCGKETIVLKANLLYGKSKTRSCGCSRKHYPNGIRAANSVFLTYKDHARKRGLDFEISKEDFAEITSRNCFYCGTPPSNRYINKNMNGEFVYNGIDRVDSEKGYTKDNIVPCCKICNIAKNNLPYQKFKEWVFRISSNMLSKELFEKDVNSEYKVDERIKQDAIS